MSYRTDEDHTSERIGALRGELAHRLDTLQCLDREHARLTGDKRRRPPMNPELNAITDDDRIALLNFALDRLQADILAQRRENEELERVQLAKQRDRSGKAGHVLYELLRGIFKLWRKL